MSDVTCHMSGVRCQMSGVTIYIYIYIFFFTKWLSLSGEGLLSTGPTPSSFPIGHLLHINIFNPFPKLTEVLEFLETLGMIKEST